MVCDCEEGCSEGGALPYMRCCGLSWRVRPPPHCLHPPGPPNTPLGAPACPLQAALALYTRCGFSEVGSESEMGGATMQLGKRGRGWPAPLACPCCLGGIAMARPAPLTPHHTALRPPLQASACCCAASTRASELESC